jgi:hypothetical protein
MRTKSLALIVILSLAVVCRAQDPVKPIVVPFELLKSQHMVVSVKINGQGPYRLIFDTGAPTILLNTRVGKDAGVVAKDAPKGPLGLIGGAGQSKIKTLELGGVKAENLPTIVMNHPTVEMLSKIGGPVEGILGLPFFARYKMTIDYQAKEMTFVPTTYEPKDVMGNMLALLLMGGKGNGVQQTYAPAAQWGFRVQKDDKDADAGVTIAEVFAGSPAAAAGLKAGDRLLTLDDRWTDTIVDTYSAAAQVRPGTAARVTIRRDGKEMELTITVRSGV